ncbi:MULTISPECIES: tRNA dihydrouridine synthase [Oceanotoga]|jgi:nifR3 family TIM-barrel protein|uniref:tRNA-dihydrouridine synthase n=1 Tax=Oceanotoga teriensis TaxID=515440 RepID=A0AA45HJW8_9BACT|nr:MULTISPECIES: tRNA-dihydrouridine synthase family protein [Oceanotoga]MDN5341580.1 tRNA-dihydrouridine synthase [Oceanotoga sp.]MDO7977828.1 tRNA-dihydrouridine synthase family protein [Oceanotoga teriensis]PWJ96512.1 nifR3 family TIM-barrel protein [Oceanotoga teriensis]
MDLINKKGLAPMADYSDYIFRKICVDHGAEFTITEMISSDAIIKNIKPTFKLLPHEDEKNIGIQLFGNSPSVMSDAAKIVENYGDWIDINAGCPVKKVVKRGAGSALLKDLDNLSNIIFSIKKKVSIPVGVKVRIGYDSFILDEIQKKVEDAGADYLIIHGRTREEFYKGIARRDFFPNIKEKSKILIGGSGDIFEKEDIDYYLNEIKTDFIIIARGAIGNPWIFENKIPNIHEKFELCLKHLDSLILDSKNEKNGVDRFKKFLVGYTKGIKGSKELRSNLSKLSSFKEVKSHLNDILTINELHNL